MVFCVEGRSGGRAALFLHLHPSETLFHPLAIEKLRLPKHSVFVVGRMYLCKVKRRVMKKSLFIALFLTGLYKLQAQQRIWLSQVAREPSDRCLQVERDRQGNFYVFSTHSGGNSAGSAYHYYTITQANWSITLAQNERYNSVLGIAVARDAPFVYGMFSSPTRILGFDSPSQSGSYIGRWSKYGAVDPGRYLSNNRISIASDEHDLYFAGWYDQLFVYGTDTLVNDTTSGAVIAKVDTSLNIIWYKTIQFKSYWFFPKLQIRNKRIYCMGNYAGDLLADQFSIEPDSGVSGSFAICLDRHGQTIWLSNLTSNLHAHFTSACVGEDGCLYAGNYAGGYDWISKLSVTGTRIWQKQTPYHDMSLDFSGEHLAIAGVDQHGKGMMDLLDTSGMSLFHIEPTDVWPWFVRGLENNKYILSGSAGENNPFFPLASSPPGCGPGYCNYSDGFTLLFKDTTTTLTTNSLIRKREIMITPNPSKIFWIQLQNHSIATIEVISSMGNCVYQSRENSENIRIDMSDKPEGIYFVRISSALGCQTQRICVGN